METAIAELVSRFERGGISRRELIGCLSVLLGLAGASGVPSVGAAQAAPRRFKATGFNHISFEVSDYARTRDFYADLLSLEVTDDDPKAKQCLLHLADGSFILPRNSSRRTAMPVVDHFAVGLANWDKPSVETELKRRGLRYREDPDLPDDSFHVRDHDGYDLQLVNEKITA